jgi:hypothetical protein
MANGKLQMAKTEDEVQAGSRLPFAIFHLP